MPTSDAGLFLEPLAHLLSGAAAAACLPQSYGEQVVRLLQSAQGAPPGSSAALGPAREPATEGAVQQPLPPGLRVLALHQFALLRSADAKLLSRVLWAAPALPQLQTLRLSHNHLSGEPARQLAEALMNATHLTGLHELDLSHGLACGQACGLTSTDACRIAVALQCGRHLGSLRVLSLRGNAIGNEGASALAYALASSPHMRQLHTLDLAHNGIKAEGQDRRAEALEASPHLAHILRRGLSSMMLKGWPLNPLLLPRVLLHAPHLGGLRSLQLAGFGLREEEVVLLARALRDATHMHGLEVLDLSDNPMGAGGAVALADELSAGSHLAALRELLLARCKLGDAGVCALACALAARCHLAGLQRLVLSGNGLTQHGGEALANALEALPHLAALRELDLACNSIGAVGVERLAAALRDGALPRLQELVLDGNAAGDAAGVALFRALRQAPGVGRGLRVLGLCGNGLGPAAAHELAALLRGCSDGQLEVLSLSYNMLGDEGSAAVCGALQGAAGLGGLSTLSLGANGISPAGASALAGALAAASHLTSLRQLGLEGNAIGDEGSEALARALEVGEHMSRLRGVDLGYCEIGPEGVARVCQALGARHLPRLASVRLTGNAAFHGVGAEAVAALRAEHGPPLQVEVDGADAKTLSPVWMH